MAKYNDGRIKMIRQNLKFIVLLLLKK